MRAAILMLSVSALFAGLTIIAKALGTGFGGEPLHPFMISSGRFAFAFLGLMVGAAIFRPKIKKPNIGLHIGRSISGWLGVTLLFAAVARMPVSDATAISFLNPAFGMVFAIPLLGEKIGKFRWIAVGIALIGALVLLRPGIGVLQPAAIIAFCSAVATGLEIVLIKKLSGRESPFQILIINNAIGFLIAGTAASFVWTTPSPVQWMFLATIGFVMIAAQTMFIFAMRAADASFAMPFMYATLLFATLYDFWIFGVVPDAISFAGAGIILSGVVFLAWREALNQRKPKPQ